MTHMFRNRSRLLGGCASAAVALALIMAPERAAAQGIQATGNVVLGSATIVDTGPTTTIVTVSPSTPTVVIDWTPNEDAGGNALPFVPAVGTGIFRSTTTPNFAVLNRILPATNNNVTAINGIVRSEFFTAVAGTSTAGLVAFSSPTGLVVGGGAIFDVGRLLLTTHDISNTSFQNFVGGGVLTLNGATGTTAQVLVNPGAQISATPENAFFAVVAADIEMRGTANVNGSHAFVVGEVVNLSFSNGLFNISVPVGTSATGEVLTVDGAVGGPSSTGVTGDNHMIYGVAHAAASPTADPISMLFSGNLGFAPAVSAGVVNGEIILAANYNVVGRNVAGGTISDGIGATFRNVDGTTNVRADIQIEDFTASSSLLAIGTHAVQATATAADSEVRGNLLLVGRESADLSALFGRNFTVTGDVLADARDYGVVSSTLSTLDAINAQGGNASISADFAGGITITGSALVTADAFGGADDLNLIAGTARGGGAFIEANDTSVLSITGSATISARGLGVTNLTVLQGAEARGGIATLAAIQSSTVGIGNNLTIRADAEGANGSLTNGSTVSDAFGGTAQMRSIGIDSEITVGGDLANLSASATGGNSNNTVAGSIGDAGFVRVVAEDQGNIAISLSALLETDGVGGTNAGGIGGLGVGGRATADVISNGTLSVTGDFTATSTGSGGDGQTGGAGLGGAAGAIVGTGQMTLSGNARADSTGEGGDATFGFGGNGGFGSGGLSLFQAAGTLTETATLLIGSTGTALSQGIGGNGGAGGGPGLVVGGRGGDARGGQFGIPNEADPSLPNNGAYFIAGGDNGSITVAEQVEASVVAIAGNGGDGTGVAGGNGGGALGGVAVLGVTINGFAGLDGSVGAGSASFSNVSIQADAVGGQGGFTDSTLRTGDGGEGRGGFGALTVAPGGVTAADVSISATGLGGDGRQGGTGRGGTGGVDGGLGASMTLTQLLIDARGTGGTSGPNASTFAFGNAFGGTAQILANGLSVDINGDVLLDASATGGSMQGAAQGGRGRGGTAYIQADATNDEASVNITGHARVYADGTGGSAVNLGIGGDAQGGIAYVDALAGGDIGLGSVQVTAVGRGGSSANSLGGAGTGGGVRLVASGAGSSVRVERNVPLDFGTGINSFFMLNANGIAAASRGGSLIGAEGRGGTLSIRATGGGAILLPTENDIANDPNTASALLGFVARGFGGGSQVEGGIAGNGFGGTGLIEADTGSQIVIGPNNFSVFGQGGSSTLPSANVIGGTGFGGTRTINVLGGSQLTFQGVAGTTGGLGGNGSGTGDGGFARGGTNTVSVVDSTLNLIGLVPVIDQSIGGNGAIGGLVLAGGPGSGVSFFASNSVINMTPDGLGDAGILLTGTSTGGAGTSLGGSAITPDTDLTLLDTQVIGGRFNLAAIAQGGAASAATGIGGDAFNGTVQVSVSGSSTGSDLTLIGENLFSVEARGGAGGSSGQGGFATSGDIVVNVTNSSVGVTGALRVRSIATGGAGGEAGDATSGDASLSQSASVVASTSQIEVASRANAEGILALAQQGGIANAGTALLEMQGGGTLDASSILIDASALTSALGISAGGIASLVVGSGFPHILQAAGLNLQADGAGAASVNPNNGAGQFAISVGSGSNVNVTDLTATAQGDAIFGDPGPSVIGVFGGNLNVSNSLSATAFDDITLTLNGGGLIGELPSSTTVTNIFVSSSGTLRVEDDDSGVLGIGGNTISLNANRSILLDGIIESNDGTIGLFANIGSSPTSLDPAEIIMSAGSVLDAGGGSVSIVMDSGFQSGGITLSNITAGTIGVRNFGEDPGSDITVLATGVLSASGTGRAIDLASLNGEVINLHGDAGLILTGGGHYGIFAATPSGSQIGSFANYVRRYNVGTEEEYDDLNPGGNFAAFRFAPTLTVTADDINRIYGNDFPGLTASITGFQPGDSIADLLGAPDLATLADSTSNVGVYEILVSLGTLVSEQGYQFDFAPGTLTVTPRPITVSADNLSRIFGNANPALTFTVGGLGLVNGDQLTGSLATTANATTNVGTAAITQGTLAASSNYELTFVNGLLTIAPRPITGVEDDLSGPFSEVTNSTTLEPANRAEEAPPSLSEEEEEELFGMDFPSQPDAQLIAEDRLLDEPVTSGGDASLYGSSDVPGAGGGQ